MIDDAVASLARTAARSALLVLAACSSQEASRRFPPLSDGAEQKPRATFGRTVLTRAAKNPMALAVTPASSVYFIERTGEVRLWDAKTGQVRDALRLQVDTTQENGLLGLALSPAFARDSRVFLYYSEPVADPPPASGPTGRNVLVRLEALPDGTLDPSTRVELLAVPSERRCCHEAGSLAFAPDGTLFLATGDNANPFEASGTAPLDARPGRESFDARRSAGNPFDLRGKILRLSPDGGVPEGNLFPRDGSAGRPEIYLTGVRNPFRLAVDPSTGVLFFGDIGPDASSEQPSGPRGYDEINVAAAPGDYGWPYCIGPNLPYVERDFATETLGAPFDCGARRPSLFAYDYDTEAFPALGTAYASDGTFTGRAAIAGAVYRSPGQAPFELPVEFEGALLMADWSRDVLAAVQLDEAGGVSDLERFLPSETFRRPIDIEVGPDGAVYVLEYGSEFWGDNSDAALNRIEYSARPSPAAAITASVTSGPAPLEVLFSAAGSRAFGEGESIAEYAWDFDADGAPDAVGGEVRHVFGSANAYTVSLVVTASSGTKSFPVTEKIAVGNAPPTVRILAPESATAVVSGVPVSLQGEANDAEEGAARCEELVWNISLGHNEHAHPSRTLNGCSVTFTPELAEHASANATDRLFYAVELVYTDHGGPSGDTPLTARQGITLELTR